MRRQITIITLILSATMLFACQVTSPKQSSVSQAEKLYQQLLNLAVPAKINSLELGPNSMEAGVLTAVYFRYTAPPAYFDLLLKHKDFAQESDFNTPIAPVTCNSPTMPSSFSYWTDQPLELEGKQCFLGVYYPYIHYLIYAPETEQVHHFVAGMSQ